MQIRRFVLVTAVALAASIAALPAASAAGGVGRPTITKIAPSSGSFKGGTRVTITGSNFRKVKYVTFDNIDARHRTVSSTGRSLTVTAPANEVGWAAVQVTTAYGQVTRTQGFLYEAPVTIDPPHDAPVSLSCPAGHCYGLDPYDNFYDAGSGTGRWTDNGPPEHNITAETQKTACAVRPKHDNCANVSCPRRGYCVSVDDLGRPLIWAKSVWKVYKPLPPAGVSDNPFSFSRTVSCGSARFCMVMDRFGDYATWNGTTWSALKTIRGRTITKPSQVDETELPVDTLSCAGTACVLLDDFAEKRKFTAGHWSNASELIPFDGRDFIYFAQVSCTNLAATGTRLLCVAGVVDQNNTYFVRYSGGRWQTTDKERHPYSEMGSVSCGRTGKCIAVRQDGTTYEYGDSSAPNDVHGWTGPIPIPGLGAGQVLASSCQAAGSCTATITPGLASTFDLASRTWSAPRRVVVARKGLSAVGCVLDGTGARFCLAGDVGPFVVDYVGGSWRRPVQKLHLADRTVSVSCVAGHRFCMAISNAGQSVVDSNGTKTVTAMPADAYTAVGCWSVRGCYAVSATTLYQWDGTTWSGPTDLAARGISAVADVACAAGNSSCLAVTGDGHSFRINSDATTSAPISMGVPSGQEVTADSCQSATRCVAVADNLYSYTGGGTGWTAEGGVGSGYRPNDVACAPSASTTHCVAVGYDNAAQSWDGQTIRSIGDENRSFAPTQTAVTCPSTTICFAGDEVGELRSYP